MVAGLSHESVNGITLKASIIMSPSRARSFSRGTVACNGRAKEGTAFAERGTLLCCCYVDADGGTAWCSVSALWMMHPPRNGLQQCRRHDLEAKPFQDGAHNAPHLLRRGSPPSGDRPIVVPHAVAGALRLRVPHHDDASAGARYATVDLGLGSVRYHSAATGRPMMGAGGCIRCRCRRGGAQSGIQGRPQLRCRFLRARQAQRVGRATLHPDHHVIEGIREGTVRIKQRVSVPEGRSYSQTVRYSCVLWVSPGSAQDGGTQSPGDHVRERRGNTWWSRCDGYTGRSGQLSANSADLDPEKMTTGEQVVRWGRGMPVLGNASLRPPAATQRASPGPVPPWPFE